MNQVTEAQVALLQRWQAMDSLTLIAFLSGHVEAEAEDDATPRKINLKAEDTPLEEENHCLKLSFSGSSC